MSRGTGKTTLLVKQSARKKTPILCPCLYSKRHIKEIAKELGLEIPEPISVGECVGSNLKFADGGNRILVDDAQEVLRLLVRNNFGAIVDTFTMSP